MEVTMKIFFCLALIIVSVCGERARRQSWRDGLWGRELELENARRKDMAAVSNLFKDEQSNTHYKSVPASETRQDDRLNLRNEVQDPQMPPFPQVIGQERSKFEFLRYPKQRQESQQE
ncbi:Hypothetical predicted protein [Paramuricea clavata]|uniref:Uncharacterized protein n=2 Tax=Paramuricea clavata TaxID=317549 RepID=A0A7D9HB51_PARCT|nr:Hypothetical predicted protein [Paramuricea clavata]